MEGIDYLIAKRDYNYSDWTLDWWGTTTDNNNILFKKGEKYYIDSWRNTKTSQHNDIFCVVKTDHHYEKCSIASSWLNNIFEIVYK